MQSSGWLVLAILVFGCGDDDGPTDAGRRDGGMTDAGSGGCDGGCGEARACCGGHCVNFANDPRNCGACGVRCGDDDYCTGRSCVPRPCTTTCGDGILCCGTECCGAGQLCCDPQGPIDMGPRCLDPSEQDTCPMGCAPLCICASPDTPIATPEGDRPIAALAPGDLVYSVADDGVVAVPVARVGRTAVFGHHVVRVSLEGGAVLEISPGHPTADGRTFADLRAGGNLDGRRILSVERVEYTHPFTYDILPASRSGAYYAGGALIGSTLAPR